MLRLHIQTSEVLRYLRVTGQPDKALQARVDQACEAVCQAAVPRYTCRYFPLERRRTCPRGGGLVLAGAIAERLEGCDGCYLMAATLGRRGGPPHRPQPGQRHGLRPDAGRRRQRRHRIRLRLCRGGAFLPPSGRRAAFFTGRFAPGYGDLSITIQKDFLFAVDAPRKIGLTVSAGGILLPQKSVTAILGRADRPVAGACRLCDLPSTGYLFVPQARHDLFQTRSIGRESYADPLEYLADKRFVLLDGGMGTHAADPRPAAWAKARAGRSGNAGYSDCHPRRLRPRRRGHSAGQHLWCQRQKACRLPLHGRAGRFCLDCRARSAAAETGALVALGYRPSGRAAGPGRHPAL